MYSIGSHFFSEHKAHTVFALFTIAFILHCCFFLLAIFTALVIALSLSVECLTGDGGMCYYNKFTVEQKLESFFQQFILLLLLLLIEL